MCAGCERPALYPQKWCGRCHVEGCDTQTYRGGYGQPPDRYARVFENCRSHRKRTRSRLFVS
jgi:hypothetical protein